MQSKAATVQQYLDELPADRRAALQSVREVILKNLDGAYQEAMQYGMIGYSVPHSVFPAGYHCDPKQPLPFAGLASQKQYMSLYMPWQFHEGPEERWLHEAWEKAGKKLDMGKSCVRFKKLEELPLEVIGEAIRRVPAKKFIAYYEANVQPADRKTAGTRTAKAAVKVDDAARNTAKAASKTAARSANKAESKAASKAASKTARKTAARSASKTAAKSASKTASKTGAKSASKTATSTPARSASKTAAKPSSTGAARTAAGSASTTAKTTKVARSASKTAAKR